MLQLLILMIFKHMNGYEILFCSENVVWIDFYLEHVCFSK